MPDGILTPTQTTAPELAADNADSRLLRHVRRNLVLWSGGTKPPLLLPPPPAPYFSPASSLPGAGGGPLEQRVRPAKGEGPAPDDPPPYGFGFCGGAPPGGVLAPPRNVGTRPPE